MEDHFPAQAIAPIIGSNGGDILVVMFAIVPRERFGLGRTVAG
jgi:hypothetical protein